MDWGASRNKIGAGAGEFRLLRGKLGYCEDVCKIGVTVNEKCKFLVTVENLKKAL